MLEELRRDAHLHVGGYTKFVMHGQCETQSTVTEDHYHSLCSMKCCCFMTEARVNSFPKWFSCSDTAWFEPDTFYCKSFMLYHYTIVPQLCILFSKSTRICVEVTAKNCSGVIIYFCNVTKHLSPLPPLIGGEDAPVCQSITVV